jgi:hypothetical protein
MISQTNLSILLHFKIQLTIYDSLKLITNVFFGVKNDLKKKKNGNTFLLNTLE